MTDNEIKKALECCIENTKCVECPMFRTPNCMNKVFSYALDLINRQKAENERLKDILEKVPTNAYDLQVEASEKLENQIKSEAIKEFAERLKEKLNNLEYHENSDRTTVTKAKLYHVVNWVMREVVPEEIDNLVKEMTEEKP